MLHFFKYFSSKSSIVTLRYYGHWFKLFINQVEPMSIVPQGYNATLTTKIFSKV